MAIGFMFADLHAKESYPLKLQLSSDTRLPVAVRCYPGWNRILDRLGEELLIYTLCY